MLNRHKQSKKRTTKELQEQAKLLLTKRDILKKEALSNFSTVVSFMTTYFIVQLAINELFHKTDELKSTNENLSIELDEFESFWKKQELRIENLPTEQRSIEQEKVNGALKTIAEQRISLRATAQSVASHQEDMLNMSSNPLFISTYFLAQLMLNTLTYLLMNTMNIKSLLKLSTNDDDKEIEESILSMRNQDLENLIDALQKDILSLKNASTRSKYLIYSILPLTILYFSMSTANWDRFISQTQVAFTPIITNLFFQAMKYSYNYYQGQSLESSIKSKRATLNTLISPQHQITIEVLKNKDADHSFFRLTFHPFKNTQGADLSAKLMRGIYKQMFRELGFEFSMLSNEKTSLYIKMDFDPIDKARAKALQDDLQGNIESLEPQNTMKPASGKGEVHFKESPEAVKQKRRKAPEQTKEEEEPIKSKSSSGITVVPYKYMAKNTLFAYKEEESDVKDRWVLNNGQRITLEARKVEDATDLYLHFDKDSIDTEKVDLFTKISDAPIFVEGKAERRNCIHLLDKNHEIYSLKRASDDDRVLGTVVGYAEDNPNLKLIYVWRGCDHDEQDRLLQAKNISQTKNSLQTHVENKFLKKEGTNSNSAAR